MKIHNIAIVGCGAVATIGHLPNIIANPRLRLIATCDINPEVAEKSCQQFKAKRFYTDWREVIKDPEVEVILVATHTNLRAEIIIPALEAGKPVYVEKPLASSLSEMQKIIHTIQHTGIPLTVGHNRRSSPAILELKRLLEKARSPHEDWLPSIDRSNGGKRQPLPEEQQIQILIRINDDCRSWKDWVFNDSEGIAFAEMVHFIDLALWLMPSPPVRVFAEGSARGNFTFLIRFQDGSMTTLQHSLIGHFDSPKELIEVSVNHVTIACDYCVELRQRGLKSEPFRQTYPLDKAQELADSKGITAYHDAVTASHERAKNGGKPILVFPDKGHMAHMNRFLDCIEGQGKNPCDAIGATVVTRIAFKLLKSLRLGLPISINPEDWHIPLIGTN